ncbi:Prenylcysteine lyase-domain-containing protein [Cladochytrium replicatum]|nr:Prenylcysteine lyase-domain-containing protein [Cladochytrium replicatum]
MKIPTNLYLLLLAVCGVCAADHKVSLKEGHEHQKVLQLPLVGKPRIAVIGGGAAGTSAAYFLSKHLPDASLTLYERSQRFGGRTWAIKVPVEDTEITVEMGASIIAEVNTFIRNASRELGLEIVDPSWSELEPSGTNKTTDPLAESLGIWTDSGFKFILSPSGISGWWSRFVMLYRYGFMNGPLKAIKVLEPMVENFISAYDKLLDGYGWAKVENMAGDLDLFHALSNSTYNFFRKVHGVSEFFVREFLGGIVRVTYTQQVDDITAFAGAISLFSGSEPMFKVQGGNMRVFKAMAESSNAAIRLNSPVTSIERLDSPTSLLKSVYAVTTGEGDTTEYDLVVLAVPRATGSISLKRIQVPKSISETTYVQVHVSVVVGRLSPAYFKLSRHTDIPYSIMVPSDTSDPSVVAVPFSSMSILARYPSTSSTPSETVVVKFFSEKNLDDSVLDSIFLERKTTIKHSWDDPGAYTRLGIVGTDTWDVPFEFEDGFYYVNSMESFLSTMETEVLSARNVVNLVREKLGRIR